MFVVMGATGHTGSVVAQTLIDRKQPVRVVVRSAAKGDAWKAKGAEVAIATYDDHGALTRAFRGARGVYILAAPNYEAQPWLDAQQRAMDQTAAAIRESGAPRVVFLSSIAAHVPDGTGPIRALRYGEQALGAATPNLTVLRPPYFMENWVPVLATAKAQGVLPTFLAPWVKIPMICTLDIGRIGADRLVAGGAGRQIVELSGPESYSPEDVATTLSAQFGRTVTAQQAPLTAVVPTFTSFGFSDDAAKLFQEMYTSMGKGTLVYETPDRVVRGSVTLADALKPLLPVA